MKPSPRVFCAPRPITAAVLLSTLIGSAFAAPPASLPVVGPTIEGRPAAPVPTGPNVSQLAPDAASGVLYEKRRIQRTVPLDPSSGLDGNWDPLYAVQEGSGQRIAYCDWDDTYIYLAVEVPTAEAVRFDLDCKDDGWLRGADNLTVQIGAPTSDDASPTINAYRFDTVQNRDQPVWAASPIPVGAMLVKTGKTPRGTYAVTLALPRTEEMGLKRAPEQSFGLRVDAGTLSDPTTETTTLAVRPMLRLTLADDVEARTPKGLRVRLILGSGEHVPGEQLKATLEAKNEGSAPIRINHIALRGSLSSFNLLDSANLTGEDVAPGKTLKRELKTGVSPSAPFATLVVTGSVESDDGVAAALSSFAHVEPYEVRLELDKKPAGGGVDVPKGFIRTAKVIVRSRAKARDTAKVTLLIPDNWRIESFEPKKEMKLEYKGDVKGIYYKLFIPMETPLGSYPVETVVEIGGRTYRSKAFLAMAL